MERQVVLQGTYGVKARGEGPLVIDEKSLQGVLELLEKTHAVLLKAGLPDVARELREAAGTLVLTRELSWSLTETA